jgi:hypothetical protein
MRKKTEERTLTITGSGAVDLQITLDYSSSFYPADVTLGAADLTRNVDKTGLSDDEAAEVHLITSETSPASVLYNRKEAITYLFTNIHAGNYYLSMHQRFKPKATKAPIALYFRSWPAGGSTATFERGGLQGLQIY